MSDILTLLGHLEEEEAKLKASKRPKKSAKEIALQNANKNRGRKPRAPSSSLRPTSKPSSRPTSRSVSIASTSDVNHSVPLAPQLQAPESDFDVHSSRSPSQNPSSLRISFGDTPRPGGNKIWIPTKTDSLASGFPYDPRLNKYRVSEEEWKDFIQELIAACDISGPKWLWIFRKKDTINRIHRDLQYEGDVKRVFKKWNKLFKRQRFQAYLELPGQKSEDLDGDAINEKISKKRFRIVLTPNAEQRAPSVYSRNSSMTKSIAGEGAAAAMARGAVEEI